MADPKLPLADNMEEQAVEPRLENVQRNRDDTDQDQGAADEENAANGENNEAKDGEENGEGDVIGEDEFGPYYRDPNNPYHGILALTEIGIRDSREMIHTALGLMTLAILVMKDGLNLGVLEWIFLILIAGLAIASAALGYLMVRYEHHKMTLAFCGLWFVMPAVCIYLIIKGAIFVQAEGHTEEQVGLCAVIFVGVIICLIVRVAVMYYVLKVFLNYGFGLRQKAFEGYIDEENRERRDPEDFWPWRGFDYRYYQNPMPVYRPRPIPRPINT